VLERYGWRIDARAGLKLPEHVAIAWVQCREPAVVTAREDQVAGRDEGAAVAAVAPSCPPGDRIGLHVHGREDAAHVDWNRAEAAAEIAVSDLHRVVLVDASTKERHAVGRANVEQARVGVVRTR